jgi:hypothetical protein
MHWETIKNLFLLQEQDIKKIQQKIGKLPVGTLNRFVKALKELATQEVEQTTLHAHDALCVDAPNHEVITENEYVRILWVTLQPGTTCIPHTHQWPSIILITAGRKFPANKHASDVTPHGWGAGVYEHAPDAEPVAFTNRGPEIFCSLYIELKKTLPKK